MWAQLIKAPIKPGKADELDRLYKEIDARLSSDSGWIRSFSLRSSGNPDQMTALVLFESQEKAREYERSPEQAEVVGKLGELLAGPPEFADFDLVTEYAPAG